MILGMLWKPFVGIERRMGFDIVNTWELLLRRCCVKMAEWV